MKHVLISGGLLAGDFIAQASAFLSNSEPDIGIGLTALAALLPAARHFANAAFVALTDHGDTFTVR